MTDTLITVDVSSAALISRAKEGQAVARENLLRVERERQERTRQEKARRERLDREQADRLGRSRLRQRGRREEVAAGYVAAPLQVAVAGWSLPFPLTEPGYNKQAIYSGNASTSVTVDIPDRVVAGSVPPPGGLEEFSPATGSYSLTDANSITLVLPIGGDKMIVAISYVCYRRAFNWYYQDSAPDGLFYPVIVDEGTTKDGGSGSSFCVVTEKSVSLKATTPSLLVNWMDQRIEDVHNYNPAENEPADIVTRLDPYVQGLSLGLQDYDDDGEIGQIVTQQAGSERSRLSIGTPATAASILDRQPAEWSPLWLDFRPSEINPGFYQGYKTRELDSTRHYPTTVEPGSAVSNLEVFISKTSSAGRTIAPLVAWDWGKPQLCRRLLLQLGFRPEDLRP